jgi:hypothetical protein
MDRVHHVGAERLLPGFCGVTDRQRADVADEDIDSAELGSRAIDSMLQRRRVGDVGRLTPSLDALVLQALTTLLTCSTCRVQIATLAPSTANRSAMARPIPLLPL